MGITTQVIGLILSLSILVFVHELGHFCFAKIFKTRVEKFYLFFNPGFSILRMKKIDGKFHFSFFSSKSPDEFVNHPEATEWGIGWLPLGGYCSIAGMVDETTKAGDLSAEPQPWEFRTKPAWQRLFIIIGGVLVNFITALVLYVAILFTWGDEYIPLQNAKDGLYFSQVALDAGFQNGDRILSVDGKTYEQLADMATAMIVENPQRVEILRNNQKDTIYLSEEFTQKVLAANQALFTYNFPFIVDSTLQGSVADSIHLQKGDRLVAMNDTAMYSFYDFRNFLSNHANKPLTLSYYRDNEQITDSIVVPENGMLGIQYLSPNDYLGTKKVEYGFFESIPYGIAKGFKKLSDYVKSFKLVFTKEGASQLGGFGTIGSIFPKVWNWEIFWNMTAFLSIILAFMNFLPIPALDGGYILFILVEMITGRKPSDKFLGIANTIGFILLFALLIYANGMDIFRALR